jgi:FkbM family methyltransferase
MYAFYQIHWFDKMNSPERFPFGSIKKFPAVFALLVVNILLRIIKPNSFPIQRVSNLIFPNNSINASAFRLLSNVPLIRIKKLYELIPKSRSQLSQDLFVLNQLDFKNQGFYVEFGGCDGLLFSNTYILENEFGWTGIIAEPAIVWQDALRRNRPNSIIENKAVATKSGQLLKFRESSLGELSSLEIFAEKNSFLTMGDKGKSYFVETISLNDLLDKYDAPKTIDFLSVDTEGSEFEILRTLDFKTRTYSVICVEHNFKPQRISIYKLLTENGYKRVLSHISLWDDWYIRDLK